MTTRWRNALIGLSKPDVAAYATTLDSLFAAARDGMATERAGLEKEIRRLSAMLDGSGPPAEPDDRLGPQPFEALEQDWLAMKKQLAGRSFRTALFGYNRRSVMQHFRQLTRLQGDTLTGLRAGVDEVRVRRDELAEQAREMLPAQEHALHGLAPDAVAEKGVDDGEFLQELSVGPVESFFPSDLPVGQAEQDADKVEPEVDPEHWSALEGEDGSFWSGETDVEHETAAASADITAAYVLREADESAGESDYAGLQEVVQVEQVVETASVAEAGEAQPTESSEFDALEKEEDEPSEALGSQPEHSDPGVPLAEPHAASARPASSNVLAFPKRAALVQSTASKPLATGFWEDADAYMEQILGAGTVAGTAVLEPAAMQAAEPYTPSRMRSYEAAQPAAEPERKPSAIERKEAAAELPRQEAEAARVAPPVPPAAPAPPVPPAAPAPPVVAGEESVDAGSAAVSEEIRLLRRRYIMGKIAGEDLTDRAGRVIAAKGQPITEAIMDAADREGKLAELIVNMVIKGLGDGV